MPPSPDDPEAESLIAAGHYEAAARRLRDAGFDARAQALLEKVWDFAGAAAIARERGDRAGVLRLSIEGKDAARISEALASLLGGGTTAELTAAAEACERKRMWREAAMLRERAGDLSEARDRYARGALWLDAGRLDERLGRLREAGRAYESALADGTTAGDPRRPHLALGRVLGALGRHEEAARHLQAGLSPTAPGEAPPTTELDAGREALVVELAALGLADGARAVLDELRARKPELPELARFLSLRAAAAGASADVLAGRYEVVRLLGSGGMGRVYLARDRASHEEVAVKVVAAPPPASLDARARDGYRSFLREARVVASLAHPNLVAVRAVHEAEGLLVMEFMAGGTLESRLRPRVAPRVARAILTQVASGLAAAHAQGIIHRDVKPANIFIGAGGEAKLGDFGVAHLQDLGATQTAGFIGTLAYMSPEQITGAPLTFACDIYALGVTTFQMLTGRLPFEGPDFVGQHLGEIAPAPSHVVPAIGRAFDGLVARMLCKDPAARYASVDALLREVAELRLDDEADAARAPHPDETAAPAPAASARTERYRLEAALATTAVSTLHRAIDERLGRPVIVERFAAGALDDAARFSWLRTMARHGGPRLQRVLRLDRAEGLVVYESVLGTQAAQAARLDAAAVARLALGALAALAGPHGDGVGHGAIARSLVVEAAGATLTVAGAAPSHGTPAPAEDLADLAALVARLADPATADLPGPDAAAIVAWCRLQLARAA